MQQDRAYELNQIAIKVVQIQWVDREAIGIFGASRKLIPNLTAPPIMSLHSDNTLMFDCCVPSQALLSTRQYLGDNHRELGKAKADLGTDVHRYVQSLPPLKLSATFSGLIESESDMSSAKEIICKYGLDVPVRI